MSSQRKLPPTSWLHRSSVTIASGLAVLGALISVGSSLAFDFGTPLNVSMAGISSTDGLCVFFLGMLLLALELEWRGAHWFIWIPTLIAAASLAEDLLNLQLYIDELLSTESSFPTPPADMSV